MRYINYRFDKAWEQGALNPFHFVLHKRMSFNYENELRAVADCNLFEDLKVYHKQNPQYFEGDVVINEGIFVPADLTALIEELVVSPYAKPWFVKLVSSVMEHYDLGEIPVRRSDLYDLV